MGKIETRIDRENDLTVYTMIGPVTAEDIIQAMQESYAILPTKLTIWDARQTELAQLGAPAWRGMAKKTKDRFSPLKRGGKSAMVVARSVDFGIGRMLEAFADIEGVEFEFKVFQNMEPAMDWLGIQR
jgi:hypothetical protein